MSKWWAVIRAWLRAGVRVEEVSARVEEVAASLGPLEERLKMSAATEVSGVLAKIDNLANVLVACPACGGVYSAASDKLVWVKVPQEDGKEPVPTAFCKWDAQRFASRHEGRLVVPR